MCHLEVSQPAGEVENVSQVSFGVSIAAGGFGQTELLGDGVKLQRTERKHLASLQQLLTCRTQTQHRDLILITVLLQYGSQFISVCMYVNFKPLSKQ